MNALAKQLMALLSFADECPGENGQFSDVMALIGACIDCHDHLPVDEFAAVVASELNQAINWVEDDTALILLGDAFGVIEDFFEGVA